jgi:hypothetical protein
VVEGLTEPYTSFSPLQAEAVLIALYGADLTEGKRSPRAKVA